MCGGRHKHVIGLIYLKCYNLDNNCEGLCNVNLFALNHREFVKSVTCFQYYYYLDFQ